MITYRQIFFRPDFFSGWRIPVAVLVQRAGGVEVVAGEQLPAPQAVGGQAARHLLQMELEALSQLMVFDSLRGVSGNHMVLGEERTVQLLPGQESVQWLRENVLPRPVEESGASLAE